MTDIQLQQSINVPPSTVYRYLTEADRWKQWQGVDAELDPNPGGIFSMTMGNGMNARGKFIELEADRRVVFTWGWIDQPGIPPGSTTVEILLEAEGSGTMLTLIHRNIPDEEAPMQHTGWTQYLPRLAQIASGVEPVKDDGPS